MKPTQIRRLRKLGKYGGDAAILAAAYYAAFALRFEGDIPGEYLSRFLYSVGFVVVTKLILLSQFGLYRFFWRQTGIQDLLALAKALSLASLLITADYAILIGFVTFPRSIILFDWFMSLLALAAFRILPRLARGRSLSTMKSLRAGFRQPPTVALQHVLLYGAGDLGASLAEQIAIKYAQSKVIVGFIDDDPARQHMTLHGVEVIGDRSALAEIATRHRIDQIIVTISAISGAKLKEIVDCCRQVCGDVQVAPGLDELFMGKVSVADLRNVQIEDLLGRESAAVNLDETELHQFLGGKTILVTGAGGSIGSELCFQILKFHPKKLVLFGRGENSIYATKHRLLPHAGDVEIEEVIGDIINYSKVDKIFSTRLPDIIFHAAADKHVPLMELNPDEAVLNNIIGTQNVLMAARAHRVGKVVCISSDKAVNPSSVMGCCKRVTELLVQSRAYMPTNCCAVRFGNVMGSRGSVIPLFKQQIAQGGPITLTDARITRYFMTIPEAVLLVLQAGASSKGGEIFLLEMGKPIGLLDLARQMIRLSGLREEDIPIKFVGLRPGEKLEEELSYPYETVQPTGHAKLYRLDSPAMMGPDWRLKVQHLKQLGISMDFDGIQRTLKEVVPEYQPQRLIVPHQVESEETRVRAI